MTDRSDIGRRSKSRGKADERYVARLLGVARYPADTGGGADIALPGYSIQVKGGGTVATVVMREGMDSARASASPGEIPAVVLIDRRVPNRLRRFIVFDLGEWADYNGYSPKED